MKDKIGKNKVVSIHYTVSEGGKKVESSRGEEPLMYLHGHDQIISGLEKALSGKEVGAKFSIDIAPEDGYGDYDDELVAELPKTQFKNQKELKVGAMFQFAAPDGEVAVARITKVKKDTVTVDQNHPFAGKTLTFEVEIIAVRAATKEELDHGHAHGPGGHHHH
jgi:FKBP-type peptidyl-prolyl cis-trans isomerase SlyD